MPSKLLLHITEYRLGELNNKHMKTLVNLTNTIFWKPLSKEISGKSLNFFGPPTRKWRPCKFFVKLNQNHLLMANIGLQKMHNTSKIWFANNKFCLRKFCLRLTGCRKCHFISLPFSIFLILHDYCQSS